MGDNKNSVSVIMSDPFPSSGGYENLVAEISEQLSRSSPYHINIVCTQANSGSHPDEIDVFPILCDIQVPIIGPIFSIILNMLQMIRHLLSNKPNLVHAHQVYRAGTIAIPARLFQIPIVCTSHGSDILVNNKEEYGIRRNLIPRMIIYFTLNFVNVHTVVSESMIDDAIEAGSKKENINIVYNGIDITSVPPPSANDRNKQKFKVVYLGRLIPTKRVKDLILAVSDVCDSIPDIEVSIGGKGKQKKELQKLADDMGVEDKIEFLGYVDEKWELLYEADVFVLVSTTEAFGMTILEAAATKSLIIASNEEPFTEILTNGESGLLCPTKSPESIASLLEIAYRNPKLRKEIGKAGKNTIENRFTVEKMVRDYVSIYQDLIYS